MPSQIPSTLLPRGVGSGKAIRAPCPALKISKDELKESSAKICRFGILTPCNERHGTQTTTLYQAETKELFLMQMVINLYTQSQSQRRDTMNS